MSTTAYDVVTLNFIVLEHGFGASHTSLQHLEVFIEQEVAKQRRNARKLREQLLVRLQREAEAWQRMQQQQQQRAAEGSASHRGSGGPRHRHRHRRSTPSASPAGGQPTPRSTAREHHHKEGPSSGAMPQPNDTDPSHRPHEEDAADCPHRRGGPSPSPEPPHCITVEAMRETLLTEWARDDAARHFFIPLNHEGNDGVHSWRSIRRCGERLAEYVIQSVKREVAAHQDRYAKEILAAASATSLLVDAIPYPLWEQRKAVSTSCCGADATIDEWNRRGKKNSSDVEEDVKGRVRPPPPNASFQTFSSEPALTPSSGSSVPPPRAEAPSRCTTRQTTNGPAAEFPAPTCSPRPVMWQLRFHFVGFSMGGLIIRAALPAIQSALEAHYPAVVDPTPSPVVSSSSSRSGGVQSRSAAGNASPEDCISLATTAGQGVVGSARVKADACGGGDSKRETTTTEEEGENNGPSVPHHQSNGRTPSHRYRLVWCDYISLSCPHLGCRHAHPDRHGLFQVANGLNRFFLLPSGVKDMLLKSSYLEHTLLEPRYLASLQRFQRKVFVGAVGDNLVWNYSSCFYLPTRERELLTGWVPAGPFWSAHLYHRKVNIFDGVVRRDKWMARLLAGDPAAVSLKNSGALSASYTDIAAYLERHNVPWMIMEDTETAVLQSSDTLRQALGLAASKNAAELDEKVVWIHQASPEEEDDETAAVGSTRPHAVVSLLQTEAAERAGYGPVEEETRRRGSKDADPCEALRWVGVPARLRRQANTRRWWAAVCGASSRKGMRTPTPAPGWSDGTLNSATLASVRWQDRGGRAIECIGASRTPPPGCFLASARVSSMSVGATHSTSRSRSPPAGMVNTATATATNISRSWKREWITEISWPSSCLPVERSMAERFLSGIGPIEVRLVDFTAATERYLDERMRRALHLGNVISQETVKDLLMRSYFRAHEVMVSQDPFFEELELKRLRVAKIEREEAERRRKLEQRAAELLKRKEPHVWGPPAEEVPPHHHDAGQRHSSHAADVPLGWGTAGMLKSPLEEARQAQCEGQEDGATGAAPRPPLAIPPLDAPVHGVVPVLSLTENWRGTDWRRTRSHTSLESPRPSPPPPEPPSAAPIVVVLHRPTPTRLTSEVLEVEPDRLTSVTTAPVGGAAARFPASVTGRCTSPPPPPQTSDSSASRSLPPQRTSSPGSRAGVERTRRRTPLCAAEEEVQMPPWPYDFVWKWIAAAIVADACASSSSDPLDSSSTTTNSPW